MAIDECPKRTCRRAGATADMRWLTDKTGRALLGAYCSKCGKWLKWVPQFGGSKQRQDAERGPRYF